MPIALIVIGLVLLIAGIRDNVGALGKLVANDFSGPNNFFYWTVSIIIVGSIGYVPGLKNPSRAFLVLILLVMILSNRGFFANLQAAVAHASAPAPSGQTASQTQTAVAAASTGSTVAAGGLGAIAQVGSALGGLTSLVAQGAAFLPLIGL